MQSIARAEIMAQYQAFADMVNEYDFAVPASKVGKYDTFVSYDGQLLYHPENNLDIAAIQPKESLQPLANSKVKGYISRKEVEKYIQLAFAYQIMNNTSLSVGEVLDIVRHGKTEGRIDIMYSVPAATAEEVTEMYEPDYYEPYHIWEDLH